MFLTLKDEQNEPSNSGINIPDGAEYVQEIPISEISDFPDHPFKVRQDEAMLNMTESIRENGVRQPAIVRPMPDGGYQMLSGHRRKAACMAIGKLTIPAVVREMSDDEAIICMVEANHQRENILPSERAFSYKMQLEAMKRQGKRNDLTSTQVAGKSESADVLGKASKISGDTVRRYVRLTELIPQLLQMVDDGKIAFRPAVELSYLTKEEQASLHEAMESEDCTPSLAQAIKIKKFSQEGRLNDDVILSILSEEKPNQREVYRLPKDRIDKYFPKGTPSEKIEEIICKALELYRRRERSRESER